jgi:hypothetical protein
MFGVREPDFIAHKTRNQNRTSLFEMQTLRNKMNYTRIAEIESLLEVLDVESRHTDVGANVEDFSDERSLLTKRRTKTEQAFEMQTIPNKMNYTRIAEIESLLEVDVESRPTDIGANVEDFSYERSFFSVDKDEMKDNTQTWCCPNGIETHTISLLLVLIATAFTFAGSWDCTYFQGATTGLAGKNYGLWTLQGIDGTCQPWDVLFSSNSLDNYLEAARALSMTAMILGLSLLTALSQALKCHVVTWGAGVAFFVLFVVSLLTSQKFNVWATFFLLLYVVLAMICRSLFIHRAMSSRASKCIAWLLILNFLFTITTLLTLNSDFCQCSRLDNEKLEGRLDPSLDPCDNPCTLGPAGVTIMYGGAAWLLSGLAVLKFGVQRYPSEMNADKEDGVTERTDEESDGDEELSERYQGLQQILKDDDDDDDFRRTCSQEICCDFRGIERTRTETTFWVWCFRFALVALCVVFGLVLVVLVGSRYENRAAERSPSTTPSFVTNVVCSFNPLDPSVPFTTYPSPEAAKADSMTVAHCGPCAYCSNLEDIKTYVTTRDTVTIEAKKCGKAAVLGLMDELQECLEDRVGFSDECRTCWVENMECDAKSCLLTCIKTLFTGGSKENNVPQAGDKGWLNRCLQCDERRCGTAFVTCSGTARRRLGIRSDIERNPDEICPHVEFDWNNYQF